MRPTVATTRVAQQLARTMVCPKCGKRLAVMNASAVKRAGFKPETVSPETHCGCEPGRPAYGMTQEAK